jgi:hypothetical protein
MVRSPSKFLSVQFLMTLKKNHYISQRGKEYSEAEVNDLLMEKLVKKADNDTEKFYKNLNQQQTVRNFR